MKRLFLGVILGVLITGCAGASFAWQYYSIQTASYIGKLLAVDPKNDKDFSICAPTSANKAPCIVMVGSDFYSLKADYMDVQNKLISCQKGLASAQTQ